MTDERDNTLKAAFNAAREDFGQDAFSDRVMRRVDSRRRLAVFAAIAGLVLLFVGAALITVPLAGAVNAMLSVLPQSWVDMETNWVATLFGPLNSVGALVALVFLLVYQLFRWLFR